MKNKTKKLLLTAILMISLKSIAQNAFIDEKPKDEITAVEFPEFTKSIIFFGEKNSTSVYLNHKKAENEVNDYFGRSYDNFVIANILNKNIAIFNNQETSIFYRPNATKTHGIIISNGIEKPIVVYDSENYLKEIKRFLEIRNPNQVVPKRKTERKENNYLEEMRRIMDLESDTNPEYAKLLINNSNTIHYAKPQKDDLKCVYKKRKFTIFQDSDMTLKGSYGANYLYDKQNRLIEQQNTINDSVVNLLKYQRDQFGLITHLRDESWLVTAIFIYKKNKFYVVYLEDEQPIHYETFYLNEKLQCVQRVSFRNDKTKITDIKYFYDNYNRIDEEINGDQKTKYKYNSNYDDFASEIIFSSIATNKILFKYETQRKGNENLFVERNELNQINRTSKTITFENCDSQTFSYDAENKFLSAATIKIIE